MNIKQTKALISILKAFNLICIIISVFLIKSEILSTLAIIIGILAMFFMLFLKVFYLERLKEGENNNV